MSVFPNLFGSVQFHSASPPRIVIGEDETEDEKERTAKKMEKATERGEGNKGGSREQKREKERRRQGKEQAGKGDRKNAAIITLHTYF